MDVAVLERVLTYIFCIFKRGQEILAVCAFDLIVIGVCEESCGSDSLIRASNTSEFFAVMTPRNSVEVPPNLTQVTKVLAVKKTARSYAVKTDRCLIDRVVR